MRRDSWGKADVVLELLGLFMTWIFPLFDAKTRFGLTQLSSEEL